MRRLILIIALSGFSLEVQCQPSWRVIQSGLGHLEKILFISNDTGFVLGYNAVGLRTSDGGMSWKQMQFPPEITAISSAFSDISFPTSSIGYMSGIINGRSLLLHTTDGGNTWMRLPLDSNFGIHNISFPSARVGYFASSQKGQEIGALAKTEDSGKTWNVIHTSTFTFTGFTQVKFRDELHGLFMEESSEPIDYRLFRTFDGLASDSMVLFCGGCEIYAPTYVAGKTWVLTESGVIQRSTDDGASWTSVGRKISYPAFGFHGRVGYGLDILIASVRPPSISKTTDAGLTWGSQPFPDSVSSFYDVSAPSDTVAYIIASYDSANTRPWRIWKTTDGGGSTFASVSSEMSSTVPPRDVIANDFASFDDTQESKVAVWDMFGRQMPVIISSRSNGRITMQVSAYTSGLYYVLTNSGMVARLMVKH